MPAGFNVPVPGAHNWTGLGLDRVLQDVAMFSQTVREPGTAGGARTGDTIRVPANEIRQVTNIGDGAVNQTMSHYKLIVRVEYPNDVTPPTAPYGVAVNLRITARGDNATVPRNVQIGPNESQTFYVLGWSFDIDLINTLSNYDLNVIYQVSEFTPGVSTFPSSQLLILSTTAYNVIKSPFSQSFFIYTSDPALTYRIKGYVFGSMILNQTFTAGYSGEVLAVPGADYTIETTAGTANGLWTWRCLA